MLSDSEIALLARAYALRHDEDEGDMWFAVTDDAFATAARLWASGRLDRRWDASRHDFLYRLGDRAWQAQRTYIAMSDAASRTN